MQLMLMTQTSNLNILMVEGRMEEVDDLLPLLGLENRCTLVVSVQKDCGMRGSDPFFNPLYTVVLYGKIGYFNLSIHD